MPRGNRLVPATFAGPALAVGFAIGLAFGPALGLGAAPARPARAGEIQLLDATPSSGVSWVVVQTGLKTGAGIAVLDYDGDELPDLFLGGDKAKGPAVFRNLGDFAFEQVPDEETGLALWPGDFRGLGAADYDNDGDVDVFLCNWQPESLSKLLRNDGGTFVDVTAKSGALVGGNASTAAWGDYDGDGFLDLYVSRYFFVQNPLFRNEGDGTFEDVTKAAGVAIPAGQPTAQTFTAMFFDWNRDGHVDLYEVNDRCYNGYARNLLWENQGDGTFVENAAAYGLDLCFDGMGAAVADRDLDGFLDLYMTNIYYGHYFLGGGCGGFTDVMEESGANAFQWGWGVVFQDLDSDGFPDLYVAHEDLGTGDGTNRVFRNLGDGTFTDVSETAYTGPNAQTILVAHADLDLDGAVDLLVGNLGTKTKLQILKNASPQGHALRIRLRGTESNREGLGAWVEVLAGGVWRKAVRHESTSFGVRSEPVLHFGLGDAGHADRVVVHWPSGKTQVLEDVPAAKTALLVVEPDASDPAPPLWSERCGDGVDNDCDGETDEFPGLGAPCVVGEGPCAVPGETTCGPDHASVRCSPAGGPTGQELCGDGVDGDCDGLTDEGFSDGEVCFAGSGACRTTGAVHCTEDGLGTFCDALPGEPAEELCGTLDDEDCDGESDEGFDIGTPCLTSIGACAAEGVLACAPGGLAMTCEAPVVLPEPELCGNGVDDDCDGKTDEGFETLGEPCQVGKGLCAAEGVVLCAGGIPLCGAVPGEPGVETCSGEDEDCDGETDEGFDVGLPCDVGPPGCEAPGVLVCDLFGAGAVCEVTGPPDVPDETCDGQDEDCDGETDEGFDPGAECTSGEGACEVPGTIVCDKDGAASCFAVVAPPAPSDERCGDAVDEDCDGETDEGFGLGIPCAASLDGCTAAGVVACGPDGASVVCALDPDACVPDPEPDPSPDPESEPDPVPETEDAGEEPEAETEDAATAEPAPPEDAPADGAPEGSEEEAAPVPDPDPGSEETPAPVGGDAGEPLPEPGPAAVEETPVEEGPAVRRVSGCRAAPGEPWWLLLSLLALAAVRRRW